MVFQILCLRVIVFNYDARKLVVRGFDKLQLKPIFTVIIEGYRIFGLMLKRNSTIYVAKTKVKVQLSHDVAQFR